ncbi:MAG: hypothetical protein JW395_4071 [Nitrospira sp.]|nr:hypothetical protein [Nitrospira sp.]
MLPTWIRRLTTRRNTKWTGCIDFGTAFSKVAMVAAKPSADLRPDDIHPLAIGRGISLNPYLLPSVVFVTADAVLFGGLAERAALRAERLGRSAFVSPKQYLSTHDPEDLDGPLDPQIDPTQSYSPRQLITLYLAYLIKRSEIAANEMKLTWPPKLRIARPAWDKSRAVWGESVLRELVRHAFILVDRLDQHIIADTGLKHKDAKVAFAAIPDTSEFPDEQIFAVVGQGRAATVTEATAVAAGSIRPKGRRVVVVADIGGGTSDFGAFMTGLPGRNVLAEIQGSSAVLRQAGDFLDMQLNRQLLNKAGLVPDDPAARGPATAIRIRQRALKEVLFNEGRVSIEVGDVFVELTAEEFLANKLVQDFAARLRDIFYIALDPAISCAKSFTHRSRVEVEIMATGGGTAYPWLDP